MTEIRRYEAGKRMSQAVLHNGTIYLAGQVGNPGDDFTAQCQTALAEIDRLLVEFGSSRAKLLRCEIWLTDLANFGAMNTVWESWIDPANPPARATCETRMTDPGYLVEIIATAAA